MKPFLLALTLGCAMAQNVQVVEMSKPDTAKAAELYQRLVDTQKEWEQFKAEMRDKYGIVPDSDQKTAVDYFTRADRRTVRYRKDWYAGIEFSADFRYVAPSACGRK